MASPSQLERTYHVFLSYRGPDSSENLVSHFYSGLELAGVHTYLDRERLQKGEQISSALSTAIDDSCIALIIFSKHYASSTWCLQEVTQIMGTAGLLVLPVFLKVEPREVRTGREDYKRALDGYEQKCKDGTAAGFSLKDVKDWRDALDKAGNLSGWVYNDRVVTVLENGTPVQSGSNEFKDEAALVKDVVEDISKRLERIPLHVDGNTTPMQSQVDKVKSILDEAQDKGLMVGLWGMGLLGKSTLAKLVYNSIFKKFEVAAFLEIGSDSIGCLQKTRLQETILRTLLTRTKLRVPNCHQGIATMKERLKTKKILLVLDGVDDICQIDDLIGKGKEFLKNESRIIITTRNKSLLLTRDATIYEVKALEKDEARPFFHKCASGNGEEEISEELVERALQCTGCVPFALQELGSKFRGKNNRDRETELGKFGSWSDTIIHKKLVKSLDGLDVSTKDIFLDIACFFNGWNRKYVAGFLGVRHVNRLDGTSYDVVASKANDLVNDLVERSLITDENGTLRVHPLIKLMGQEVADGELARNLRKRSRLWRWRDVEIVLSDDKGKYDVEAIVLAPEETKELENIDSNAFERLENLSSLIMINVEVKRFPDCMNLPRQLRWFEWPEFPASRLKFAGTPCNPAVLAVRKSLFLRNQGDP